MQRVSSRSGTRRRVVRIHTDLSVVLSREDGSKQLARVMDLSVGGMHLQADEVPEYGESLTLVLRLSSADDWMLLPARVRWFTGSGFGVEFRSLDRKQAEALARFVDAFAA